VGVAASGNGCSQQEHHGESSPEAEVDTAAQNDTDSFVERQPEKECHEDAEVASTGL